jgi:Flp pilus assembly protein TadB
MSRIGSLFQLVKLVPAVLEIARKLRPKETEKSDEKAKAALSALKRTMEGRLDEAERANGRLQTRIRELEASLTALRLAIYIGLPALALLAIILLVLVLTHLR